MDEDMIQEYERLIQENEHRIKHLREEKRNPDKKILWNTFEREIECRSDEVYFYKRMISFYKHKLLL